MTALHVTQLAKLFEQTGLSLRQMLAAPGQVQLVRIGRETGGQSRGCGWMPLSENVLNAAVGARPHPGHQDQADDDSHDVGNHVEKGIKAEGDFAFLSASSDHGGSK